MIKIIAEIGQNHNGDMSLARELIAAAKGSGADVAKFQLYDAAALFPKERNEWYEYNCKTEINFDQALELANECRRQGIEFMASPFVPEGALSVIIKVFPTLVRAFSISPILDSGMYNTWQVVMSSAFLKVLTLIF